MKLACCIYPFSQHNPEHRKSIAYQALESLKTPQTLVFSENPFSTSSSDNNEVNTFLSQAKARHIDVIWESTPSLQGQIALKIDASAFDIENFIAKSQSLNAKLIPLLWMNRLAYKARKLYPGGLLCMDPKGGIRVLVPLFESTVITTVDTDQGEPLSLHRTALLYRALSFGLKMSFLEAGIQKAVIGLSGGIDSAVALPIAVAALGPQNVTGVLLPSQFTSQASIEDALLLAHNLGVATHTIPITDAFEGLQKQIKPCIEGEKGVGLMAENIQARLRGLVLMAFANAQGAAVINTTNKSEACMGYGTLYGDLIGLVSVLGDVFKAEVYDLARWINTQSPVIPQNSIDREPSAELRPDQKDSDTLPPYPMIDTVMAYYLHTKFLRSHRLEVRPEVDEALFKSIVNRFKANVYKRRLAPEAIRVSDSAFGVDIPY